MEESTTSKTTIILGVLFALILFALLGYFGYKAITLHNDVLSLTEEKQRIINEKNATTQTLLEAQTTIEALMSELSLTNEDLEELENDYRKEKKKNDAFEDQINTIMGTVGDLDKLSKTDEELLQKYSKVYFLNENYIPSKIRKIDDEYILAGREQQYFHGDALPFLESMLNRAERDGTDLKVISAYRSFDSQEQLKGAYTQTYGSGANAFSADQGYSEHQLGTTLDLSDTTTNGPYIAFQDTETYRWLLKNAYLYGFTLSYPDDNGFYVFEPWHWRFVGEELAEELYDNREHFYDMEQREIDQYLIKIFD
ncbi:MAG: D-alanyl-D-alanine carboxypeptidase [Acidimicrobiales bacterium]|jgi:D-alanyl-D-alanine carboxypeptidase